MTEKIKEILRKYIPEHVFAPCCIVDCVKELDELLGTEIANEKIRITDFTEEKIGDLRSEIFNKVMDIKVK